MLGKTNITTVKRGTIVSDVEEYSWDNISVRDINSAFRRCFFGNNTLVGISMDGQIVYTIDGENWTTADLQMEAEYKIMDGLWDGKQFVFVGSHDVKETDRCSGLIVTTEDFSDYDVMLNCTGLEYSEDSVNESSITITDEAIREAYCGRLYAIMLNDNATYTVLSAVQFKKTNTQYGYKYNCYFATGELNDLKYTCFIEKTNINGKVCGKALLNQIFVEVAKKTNAFLFYVQHPSKSTSALYYDHTVGVSTNGNTYITLENSESEKTTDERNYIVFECKDSLYYMSLADGNGQLIRVRNLSESGKAVISTGIDGAFISAVYFNKCEIFIDAHQMLIVKQGESIEDKNQDDLVEITYDFSLTSIIKAFNKLYLFGTGGNVLVSNNEVKNEESLAVKTMSAIRALFDAKAYTDQKHAELEARIVALENRS